MSGPLPRTLLVLGGARSGKSAFAERLVRESGRQPVIIATAEAGDAEMALRIARHRQDRGPGWIALEEPLNLAAALEVACRPDRAVLVDCLTLWLSNLMHAGRDPGVEGAAIAGLLPHLPGPVVFVSNEIGLGLVPDTSLGRRFRDAQGRLNQTIAAATDQAVFVAAGLPLVLKPAPELRLAP